MDLVVGECGTVVVVCGASPYELGADTCGMRLLLDTGFGGLVLGVAELAPSLVIGDAGFLVVVNRRLNLLECLDFHVHGHIGSSSLRIGVLLAYIITVVRYHIYVSTFSTKRRRHHIGNDASRPALRPAARHAGQGGICLFAC